jgi:hypothetical protein
MNQPSKGERMISEQATMRPQRVTVRAARLTVESCALESFKLPTQLLVLLNQAQGFSVEVGEAVVAVQRRISASTMSAPVVDIR